jgi:HEAT repeat protein
MSMQRWLLVMEFGLLGASLALAQGRDIRYLGKPAAEWAQQLKSPEAQQRRCAAFALGKIGPQAQPAVDDLLALLKEDRDAAVREAAAGALGRIGQGNRGLLEGGRVVPALIQALKKDPSPQVRRSAAWALGLLGADVAPVAAPALVETLKNDADLAVLQNAAWALGALAPDNEEVVQASVSALRHCLRGKDAAVLRETAKALSKLGEAAHAALPELLLTCDHPNSETRAAAVRALLELATPQDKDAVAPALEKILKSDPNPDTRRNAALALGKVGDPAALPALQDILDKGDSKQKQQAALALGGINSAEAVALLRKTLKDADPELRLRAAVSLGKLAAIATDAYEDLLQIYTQDPQESVRLQAATALQKIGSQLTEAGNLAPLQKAVPQVLPIIQDPGQSPELRGRGLWVLRPLLVAVPDHSEILKALEQLVQEPRNGKNYLLRYDAAYLLGNFQRAAVSDKTLDVLAEFLRDKTIQLFTGPQAQTTGAGEGSAGGSQVRETGKGDGRLMALQALERIGRERIARHPGVVQALRQLVQDSEADNELRQRARRLLGE